MEARVTTAEARLLPLAIVLGLLASCSGAASPIPSDQDGSATAAVSVPAAIPEPTTQGPPAGLILLVSPAGGGAAMEANVAGVIGISPAGCVTVGDFPLVAPPGSVLDGDEIHLEGIGDVVIGQPIAVSGGVAEVARMPLDMRPRGYEQCQAIELAILSGP